MLFSYQMTNNAGKIITSTIEASSRKVARNKLLLQDGTLISLKPVNKGKRAIGKSNDIVFGKVKLIEKVMFAKHLSVMIKSGMSIDGALDVLRDSASPLFKKRLTSILSEVRQGNPLSAALKQHPRDFDLLFVNMVFAGEKGGNLANNLNLLAIQERKSYDLKNKIKAASMYPTLVLIAVVGLTVVVSKFVLPKIINFFTSLSVELPLSTKILITTSTFFVANWLGLLIALILLVVVWKIALRFPISRLILHKFILSLPLTGAISANMNLALFCRTLASLLDSGITIDQALQIVSQTLTSEVYSKQTIEMYHKVLKGNSLSASLAGKSGFPKIVSRMIEVGEESGNLSEVLEYLADFYELEVDNTTKNLSAMLEPILLVVIGLGVGFVAMSIINPIYELTSQVGR